MRRKPREHITHPITEIAAKIEHFPSKFSITERGEFALGYYYQYNKKINDINNE